MKITKNSNFQIKMFNFSTEMRNGKENGRKES